VCGCAREAHERAGQRFAHDVIEKRADFIEQRDLSLAVAAAARLPIGSAIGLLGDRPGGQCAYDVRVELLRQDLELYRVTQCVQCLGRQQRFHDALDFLQVAVTRTGVLAAIQLAEEKCHGAPVARARMQIRVRAQQPPSLPGTQLLQTIAQFGTIGEHRAQRGVALQQVPEPAAAA
jgi:hypothetical protein